MSKLVGLRVYTTEAVYGEMIQVSELKKKYIVNIIKSANACKFIDKIILFGSCLEERCNEYSDIDIAVFGDRTQSQMYKLASYRKFSEGVCSYDIGDLQSYDIFYFKEGDEKNNNSELMKNILSGRVIYRKQEPHQIRSGYTLQDHIVIKTLIEVNGYLVEDAIDLWENSMTRHNIQKVLKYDWVSPQRCYKELQLEIAKDKSWLMEPFDGTREGGRV